MLRVRAADWVVIAAVAATAAGGFVASVGGRRARA